MFHALSIIDFYVAKSVTRVSRIREHWIGWQFCTTNFLWKSIASEYMNFAICKFCKKRCTLRRIFRFFLFDFSYIRFIEATLCFENLIRSSFIFTFFFFFFFSSYNPEVINWAEVSQSDSYLFLIKINLINSSKSDLQKEKSSRPAFESTFLFFVRFILHRKTS